MHSRSHTWVGLIGVILFSCTVPGEVKPQEPRHPKVAPPLHLRGSAYEASARVALPDVVPDEPPELHNVYRLSANLVSGSEPHGERAFEYLRAIGVRTILSVDGKVPDQAAAARHGMSYVHVPIQYKGIAEDELAHIAKTFREKEGPFFVHCFHGKHRGPAAAAIGRLVLDGIARETALAEMRQCGTAASYEGLYAAIAAAEIPDADATHALQWDFPAASPLDGVAGAMVAISRADDHLKTLSKREWKPDPAHPDVDPAQEALKLTSLFERADSLPQAAALPADFHDWMRASARQAGELRELLRDAAPADRAQSAYEALSRTCSACHKAYRN